MKFINLLKKELSELINKQMIFSLVFVLGIFLIMGKAMSSATTDMVNEVAHPQLNICDMDDTELTNDMLDSFRERNANITKISIEGEDYASAFNGQKFKSYVVIPKGFTEEVESGKKPEVLSINKVQNATALSGLTGGTGSIESLINGYVSVKIAEQQGISKEGLGIIEDSLKVTEYSVVADKSAQVSTTSLLSKLMTQNMILPIIVLMLILLTSQSLIASISNEKIDKTLETLLSAPISRGSVITAKMLAAAIVALINAGAMMIGFSSYIKAMGGAVTNELGTAAQKTSSLMTSSEAFKQLGLTLSAVDYLLIGIQLFLTIMICLAISIILGALVNDTKSSQTMLLPIMLMVMIPWLVTLFADINTLPTAAKAVVMAIPFTHTFTAMPNLMFGNYSVFWIGLAYQAVFFAVVMFFALKLFKSDKILTISLNFGQKSKFKKSSKNNED